MDYDEVDNMDMNETCCHRNFQPPSMYLMVPALLICIVSFLLDILIVFIISKCKDLQTISNLYILNWRICNMLFLLASPPFYIVVFSIYEVEVSIYSKWQGELVILFTGNAIFVVTLLLDWYFLNYSPSISLNIRKHFKTVIVCIWLIIFALSLYICLENILGKIDRWIFSLITGCLVIVIVVQVLRLFKMRQMNEISNDDEKTNLVLFLVISYFISWFATYIVHAILIFDSEKEMPSLLHTGMSMIGCFHSVFVFCSLCYFEKDFRSSLKKLCKCKTQSIASQKSDEDDKV